MRHGFSSAAGSPVVDTPLGSSERGRLLYVRKTPSLGRSRSRCTDPGRQFPLRWRVRDRRLEGGGDMAFTTFSEKPASKVQSAAPSNVAADRREWPAGARRDLWVGRGKLCHL